MKTKCFLCFAFDKQMPVGKPTFFCILWISKTKQILEEKKTWHCSIHLNKRACKFGAVLAMNNFSQTYLTPFFHCNLQFIVLGNHTNHTTAVLKSLSLKKILNNFLPPESILSANFYLGISYERCKSRGNIQRNFNGF